MKTYKFLAVAAVFGCYVFGIAGASAQQICPVGGGACVSNPTPASSYTSARSVDVTPRLPVVDPLGPSGSYCGFASFIEGGGEGGGGSSSIPCLGHSVLYPNSTVPDCPAGYQAISLSGGSSVLRASCIKL